MIRDKKNQMQFISYDSLSITREYASDKTGHGLYHPADIDGVLQFNAKTHPMNAKYNQAVLFYEFKRRNAIMSTGQRILLESLANGIQQSGGYSLVAVVRFSVDNPEIDVDGGRGIVTEYFYDRAWRKCKPMTAIEFTDCFLAGAGLKKDKGVE
jgi:hypothetical protein